jgi:DNA-3-methyladenine glycosylase I
MERAQELGYARSIGVSNFDVVELDQVLETANIAPVVNQVQFSPYEYRKGLLDACRAERIVLEAYSPLGHGQHIGSETATRIAQRLGHTPAQVLLRWCIERDVPVIAKSTHRDRIAENAQIFDFRLSNADMAELDALDRTGGTQRALERKWWWGLSSDVIIGQDGKPRCVWAGAGDTAFGRYHDEVWGTRTYDETALFEALTLGVFQVGLSWSIVFGKRDAFRKAFRSFNVAKVAGMTERDVDRLVQDASIIRNRGKIQATVENARAMTSASPSLDELAKSHESTRRRAPRSLADLPTSTPEAEAFAKQLKSQGYRFVGPTSVYAFMQNVGVVNDHIHGCFRADD